MTLENPMTKATFTERIFAMNPTEKRACEMIEWRGKSEVLRAGWPDFLVRRRRDNKLFGVEVKDGNDIIRPSQKACFAALEKGGIPVFIWHPGHPAKFIPWRQWPPKWPTKQIRSRGDLRLVKKRELK